MISLPLAVGMIDIEVNTRRFDTAMADIRAKLARMPSVHNIAVNVSRAQATSSVNLLMQQIQALRTQAAIPVQIKVARRGSLFAPRGGGGGGGGGGAGTGLGMGVLEGLGVAGLALNPAMMAGQMLGSGLREAVGTAMNLESTFVDIRRVTGESAGNVEKFKKSIFDIGKSQAGVSIKDLTDIAMAGAKSGVSDKEGLAGLETFTRGMAAVRNSVQGIGTEKLADDMTRMLNLFNKGTDYVRGFGSVLARMDNLSTASASSILEMSKSLSGTFASLGLGIPDVMAFSSVLADSGLTAQQGASSFSQILRVIASDTNKFAAAIGMPLEAFQAAVKGDALNALKLVIDKFKEINKVDTIKAQEWIKDLGFIGVRTSGAFQQVAANMEKLAERRAMAVEEETSFGSLLAANALKSETTAANVQKLSNAFLELADSIGKITLGPLTEGVKTLQMVIGGLGKEKGKGGTEPLSFLETVQFMDMSAMAALGGPMADPEKYNELKRRYESSFAAGNNQPLEAPPVKAADLKPGPGGVPTAVQALNQAWADAAVARDIGAPGILEDPGLAFARAQDRAQARAFTPDQGVRGKAAASRMLDLLGGKAATSSIFELLGQGHDIGPGLIEKMATGWNWPVPLKSPSDALSRAAAGGIVPERRDIGVAISGEEMLKRFQEEALKGKDEIGERQLAVQEKMLTGIETLTKKPDLGAGVAHLS